MSQLNQTKNDVNPSRIYYDIQVTNIESSTSQPPILYFNESRNVPFINVPEDYYMSIIRFTLDTQTLPIFIPTIQTNPVYNPTLDLNKTIYSFQFSYGNFNSGEIFIEWSPQNSYLEVPPLVTSGNISVQDITTGYYDCYTFEFFINLINQQMETAFNAFKASVVGFPVDAISPQIAWDASQNVARLIFEKSFLNSNATPIFLFFNSALYGLFGSFNVIRNGYNLTNGKNFQILVIDYGGFNSYQLTDFITGVTYDVIEIIQEYSTISAWSPISSIVFTSNTMPIVSNQLSKPTVFVEGSFLGNYGNNSNFQQIITDLVTDTGFYKPSITYNPTAEYRYISMTGNQPLTNVDISVFYKTRVGQLVPFRLNSGGTCTLKILFSKKDSC
jgi:hypothetical protein